MLRIVTLADLNLIIRALSNARRDSDFTTDERSRLKEIANLLQEGVCSGTTSAVITSERFSDSLDQRCD